MGRFGRSEEEGKFRLAQNRTTNKAVEHWSINSKLSLKIINILARTEWN
jgi:hypothetical protein